MASQARVADAAKLARSAMGLIRLAGLGMARACVARARELAVSLRRMWAVGTAVRRPDQPALRDETRCEFVPEYGRAMSFAWEWWAN